MKKRVWLLAIIVIAGHRPVIAQSRPDFSGTWNPTGSWNATAGSALTVRQNANTLTVSRDGETRIYNLDGSESSVEKPNSSSRKTARVSWVGSALVISTVTVAAIGTWETLEVYSVDYGPKLSVVEVGSQTTTGVMYTTVREYTRR